MKHRTRVLNLVMVMLTALAATNGEVGSNEGKCDRDGGLDCSGIKCPSSKVVVLQDILLMPEIEEGAVRIFFVESSGRSVLSPRQTCSLESALSAMERGSAPYVVVMAMTSPTLELSGNATCHLYHKFVRGGQLRFVYADTARVFRGTPLESVYASGSIERSEYKIVQLSDALRLVLIHRFGGWYSDLDMVFLRPLDPDLRNVLSGDQLSHGAMIETPHLIGDQVNNAIFNFDRAHFFTQMCLHFFAKRYDPENRLSGGPHLLSFVLKLACDVPQNAIIDTRDFTAAKCAGVSVAPQHVFYPVGWFNSSRLYDLRLDGTEWDAVFAKSIAIHMYNSMAPKQKILRPKYYGAKVPGYLHLAINRCPISYYSEKTF